MDRRELLEAAALLVCAICMLIVGINIARSLAAVLAFAFVMVQ